MIKYKKGKKNILIIPVPPGILVYLKLWKTNYKWCYTKQFMLLKEWNQELV